MEKHISLKDFNVGQNVYILNNDRREEVIIKATVLSVGRKYITVDRGYPTSKYSVEDHCPFGLIEKVEYGGADICFPSMQALNDYKEKKSLDRWFYDVSSHANKYSLEQLRKVKEILGG